MRDKSALPSEWDVRQLTLDKQWDLDEQLRKHKGLTIVSMEFMETIVGENFRAAWRMNEAERKLIEINFIQAQFRDKPRAALRRIRKVLHR